MGSTKVMLYSNSKLMQLFRPMLYNYQSTTTKRAKDPLIRLTRYEIRFNLKHEKMGFLQKMFLVNFGLCGPAGSKHQIQSAKYYHGLDDRP